MTAAPEFSNMWFSRDIQPDWERLLVPLAPFSSYLEIGVCEAASYRFAIERLLKGKRGDGWRAMGVDPYHPKREKLREVVEAQYRRALANLEPWRIEQSRGGFAELRRQTSAEYLRGEIAKGSRGRRFDLVYIDGDHGARGALLDLLLCWDLLETGGILILDDINRRARQGKPLVFEALIAFELTHSNRLEAVFQTKRQKAWRKIRR